MKMTCPLCGEEIKIDLNFILVQKCDHCKKKIAEGRKGFNAINAMGMFFCLFLVIYLQDSCAIPNMNKALFDCLTYAFGIALFGLLQLVLLLNCHKFKKS